MVPAEGLRLAPQGIRCLLLEQVMTKQDALRIVQDSFTSLHRTGILAEDITAQDQTVLLGAGSPLDSIAFVTFVTDVEDRLSRELNHDVSLVLTDLHQANADASSLTVDTFARYLLTV